LVIESHNAKKPLNSKKVKARNIKRKYIRFKCLAIVIYSNIEIKKTTILVAIKKGMLSKTKQGNTITISRYKKVKTVKKRKANLNLLNFGSSSIKV
jgi:hypothetical protein